MVAVTKGLTVGGQPAELVLRRKTYFAELCLGAAIKVAQLTAVEGPFENCDVGYRCANLEQHVKVAFDERKLGEERAVVNVVESLEVLDEFLLLQYLHAVFLERARGFVAIVNGEDV